MEVTDLIDRLLAIGDSQPGKGNYFSTLKINEGFLKNYITEGQYGEYYKGHPIVIDNNLNTFTVISRTGKEVK